MLTRTESYLLFMRTIICAKAGSSKKPFCDTTFLARLMMASRQNCGVYLSEKIVRYAVKEGESTAIPLPPPKELCVCGKCAKSLRGQRRQYCSGCESMTYCDSGCQLTDWKEHRHQCSFYRALIWSRKVLSQDKRMLEDIARKIVSYIAITPYFKRKQARRKRINSPLENRFV